LRTFTTKSFSLLPDAEEARSNGSDLNEVVIHDETEKVQLEATIEDIELFEQETGIKLDSSDVIAECAMEQLIDFLNTNRMLENPV
jgi:hypothetical protein